MSKRKLESCHKVMDFRRLAEKRLPAPMFHYIDGAAEDEWTYRQNTSAFNHYELVPHFLVNACNIFMLPSPPMPMSASNFIFLKPSII